MKLIHSAQEMKELLRPRTKIGFVPTMGALHQGHLALVQRARAENTTCVASVFVNPTQFNNPIDFQKYPQSLEQDAQLLEKAGVDILFAPHYQELYPDDYRYRVEETQLSQLLCGAHRPGHFAGMLTVVLKLLNLIKPDRAYFGEKDFQQLELIRGLKEAFFLDVEIIAHPTQRDEAGLALSSRNQRLSPQGLALAQKFAQVFQQSSTLAALQETLAQLPLEVEYLEERNGRRFAAVHVEGVRLIDNVAL